MLIADLAKEVGVSVGTIYQYVASKEDILFLVVEDILETYRIEVPKTMEGIEDPVERLAAGFRAYCGIVDSRRAATLLGYQESRNMHREGLEKVKELELETNRYFIECISEAVDQGRFVCANPDLAAFNLVISAHTWALKHWYMKGRFNLEQFITTQLAMTLRALLADKFRASYLHLTQLEA